MKYLLRRIIILLLLIALSDVSFAEGIGPGLDIPASRGVFESSTFYAYKNSSEQISWLFRKITTSAGSPGNWTMKLYSPSGVLAAQQSMTNADAVGTVRSGSTTSTEQGIWTYVIEDSGIFYSSNMNVTSGGSNVPGRVYAYQVSPSASGVMDDFSVFSINEQGYKYTSTFYGLYPVNIRFRINPFGNVFDGTCNPAYKSYTGGDGNVPIPADPRFAQSTGCGGDSKIFFNPIASDLPASASRYDVASGSVVTEWLNPGLALESVSGLTFTPTSNDASGTFAFNVSNYIGSATLKIDVDNNGIYTDAVDRSISQGVNVGNNTIPFDGIDGEGNAIDCGTTMKGQIVLDRPGEIHFVLWDAEGLGGIRITRSNGPGSPSSLISWDDTFVNTTGKVSTTPVLTGTNVNSANSTTHGWTNTVGVANSWGDNAYIDNWAYLPGTTGQEITFVAAPCPPVANNDTIDGTCSAVNISVLSNDIPGSSAIVIENTSLIDPANNLRTTSVTIDGEGTYTLNATNGVVTFSPDPDGFSGTTTLRYVIVDENGLEAQANIIITVDCPMPVTLTFFSAASENQTINLTWATTEETGSDRFEIERSTDAQTWIQIGVKASHGESKVLKNYDFVDRTPATGINYYRLKMVDKDETFAYSRIKSVNVSVMEVHAAYPNPVSDRLRFNNFAQVKQIVIYNTAGVKVMTHKAITAEGLDVSKLTPGVYTLTLTLFDGSNSIQKIAIAK